MVPANTKPQSASSSAIDMSVKVGGRVFIPALPVVDGEFPTEIENKFQQSLAGFVAENIPLESRDGIQTRERVLDQMGVLCREWIRSVCASKGLAPDVIEMAGGALYTSGSYRLGVHEPGADIDTILVAPSFCRRSDFFGLTNLTDTGARDPNSLAERIRNHPDVENFVAVDTAAVPILTFDWSGINIDLLFARVNTNSVLNIDIDNDSVLDGADGATEKSLNGPRVTNLIAALVSGTPERYQTFLTVVRCVRKWAKVRGLYSNKMGYWGGVNINIGVALCIQMYPNACAASLLRKFFLVFKTWRWPQPVMLTKPHDAGYGLPVWTQQGAARQIAPMITPAYPAMNSTLSVSRQTLQILQSEFERGHAIVDSFWKQLNTDQNAEIDWSTLFEPSDFFINYPHYLSLCIVGPSQNEAQAWGSFVESRFRKLVSDQLGRSLPLKKIQLWPKKLEYCVADKGAILTLAQRQNAVTYFIGFQVDKYRMRGTELNVEGVLQKFREWDLLKFQPLLAGMDILAKIFTVKELPKVCFMGMYDSKEAAMKKRRAMLESDPARQERKRQVRLAELKAKMAEIQRKKDSDNDKKRKHEEVELEEAEEALALTGEEEAVVPEPIANEETNLLESALDTIQDIGEKTREEAEAERQKLLSGEQLDRSEADVGDESDEDEYGYMTDRNRPGVMVARPDRDMRSLPPTVEQLEVLRKLGCSVVTDDESKVIGGNATGPWTSVDAADDDGLSRIKKVKIKFLEPFDVVQLDPLGHVIDKGDDDFTPSAKWTGRKAGFEFKLGERGLGYYRTGKPIVVPSNMIY